MKAVFQQLGFNSWRRFKDAKSRSVSLRSILHQDNFSYVTLCPPLFFFLLILQSVLVQFALSPSDFSSSEVPEEELKQAASRGVRIMYNFPWGQEPLETLWSRGETELLQMYKEVRSQLQVSLLLSYCVLMCVFYVCFNHTWLHHGDYYNELLAYCE